MTQTSKPGGAGPVRTPPTGGLATARRNAAVLRGLLGALGVLLVATHPALHPVPWAAAAGAVVIILTSPSARACASGRCAPRRRSRARRR